MTTTNTMTEREQIQVCARSGASPRVARQVARGEPTVLAQRVLVILGARNAGLEEKLPDSAWEGTELVFPGGRGAEGGAR